ncbi:hypothetical protein BX600DRAFT_431585 [Xylariales sp. PMI_506]|nr:hypothetical protein BX600DRAFT_431585 [Xylariales sp. PMI_506]
MAPLPALNHHMTYEPLEVETQERRLKKESHPVRGWRWELLAIITSIGCLVAVVIILAKMQDQPLSNWTFRASLNATVAFFITISRAAALYVMGSCISQFKWLYFSRSPRKLRDLDLIEDASRGPLGALMLLIRTRFRLSFLILLGAVATVLALGVDTFGQLVVDSSQYRTVRTNDGQASFGVTHIYDSGVQSKFIQLGGNGAGSGLAPNASTIDMSMEGAVYQALFNVERLEVFKCPSNCVWNETYISLGFTANCSDVSAATRATVQTPSENNHWYNMTTPGNISLSAGLSMTSWLTLASVSVVDLLSRYNESTPTEPIPISPVFARIAILTATEDNVNTAGYDDYPGGWQIEECTIGLAAYEYSNMSASGTDFDIKNHTTAISLNTGTLNNTILTFNQSNLPPMTVQGIDLKALSEFFTSSSFSGAIYSGEEPPESNTGVGNIMRQGNISAIFDDMATSMTDQLRSGYNLTAAGLTVESVIYVQVHWGWLSLALFVPAVAALLLAFTVINSCIDRRPLWKSSLTAMLFHEVAPMRDDTHGNTGIIRSDVRSLAELQNLTQRTWGALEE